MALSICCLTDNPGKAAATLAGLRDAAEEIVVAVDASGGEKDLAALAGLADRLLLIEPDGPMESALTWLHGECSADWIMRVEDDEVVSTGLLEQLEDLTRARDVLQYWIARRWLHPGRGHWIDQWPWFPDFQGRVVRNDPRLWFQGGSQGMALALPARYLDCGLYKLANLLEADPDVSTHLPEAGPDVRTAPVDPRDRGRIDAVLAWPGDDSRRQASAPEARRVSSAEVSRRWAERELDESAYRAAIRPVDIYRRLADHDHRQFRVCVRNEGTEWWPGGEERRPLIRLAYRWLTPQGVMVEREGLRTPLPHPLAPGESCLMELNLVPPANAGTYLLVPDVVHEHVRWFECGAPPIEMVVGAAEQAPR